MLWLLVSLFTLPAASASAQEHTVLLRLLRDGDSFRVRARAAIALGRSGHSEASRALERALDDQHAAVRAAAATALGHVGDPRSRAALERAQRDPAPDVAKQARLALRALAARSPDQAQARQADPEDAALARLKGARYVVVIGEMRNDSGLQEDELGELLAVAAARQLGRVQQVAVFRMSELSPNITRIIAQRKMPLFRMEGSLRRVVSSLVGDEHAVRAEVSLLLLDEPGRNMRSMMRGAASGSESLHGSRKEQLRVLARSALRNAVRSAMSNASEAIEAAALSYDSSAEMQEGPAEASLRRSAARRNKRRSSK